MDVQPLKIIDEGTPGYRTPWELGTVDVFAKRRRYVFLKPEASRTPWREAVARLILGPGGKSSDLIRLDSVLPGKIAGGRQSAKQYRVGELKRAGAPTKSARRPDDPPLWAAAGLTLVDHLPLGDPRRDVPGWGKRRGEFLVLDSVTGGAWFFRCGYGGQDRMALKAKVIRAWALNDGPPVEVRGRYPGWIVTARQWTKAEKAVIVSARTKAALWRAGMAKDGQAAERAAEEKRARIAAERATRAEVARLALRVGLKAESLKRAEVSALRWPSAERDEAVRARAAWLDATWTEYLRAYELAAARYGQTGRRLARPAEFLASVGKLPRPAWVILPWAEENVE